MESISPVARTHLASCGGFRLNDQRRKRTPRSGALARYVDHIRSVRGVQWITASDLPELYPDELRSRGATEDDLREIATRISDPALKGLDYQRFGSRIYSVADQFEALARAVFARKADKPVGFPIPITGLLGPDASPPSSTLTNLDAAALRDALAGLVKFIDAERRVPARVFVGAEPVAPGAFMLAMAHAWIRCDAAAASATNAPLPLGPTPPILTERHVADDTPGLFGNWIIHRACFRAPKLVELGKLQAWTLKPAMERAR